MAEEAGHSQRNERRVGLVYDERMCNHNTPDGDDHPECPDRIRVIWNKLRDSGLTDRCVVLNGKKAEDKHTRYVHSKTHLELISKISSKRLNSQRNRIASKYNSIYLNKGSSEAAYLAAGSVIEAAEKVAKGELDSAFAIVRPPGHHAEENEPMGFCLFNNVAVAASYLLNERAELGIHRILVVDWDVHHGNATQKMFWKDSRVLFFSVHRHDFGHFYPETDDGDLSMIGEGSGEGYNINVPWEQGGCGDADYFAAWDHILIPVVKEFNPDMIIVSAGFDAAVSDPLGGCCVSPFGYSVLLRKLMDFAQGKILLALEGRYNLESLANSAHACVQELLEEKPIDGSSEAYPVESTWRVIENVRQKLSVYWPSLANKLSKKPTSQKAPASQLLVEVSSEPETEGIEEAIEDIQSFSALKIDEVMPGSMDSFPKAAEESMGCKRPYVPSPEELEESLCTPQKSPKSPRTESEKENRHQETMATDKTCQVDIADDSPEGEPRDSVPPPSAPSPSSDRGEPPDSGPPPSALSPSSRGEPRDSIPPPPEPIPSSDRGEPRDSVPPPEPSPSSDRGEPQESIPPPSAPSLPKGVIPEELRRFYKAMRKGMPQSADLDKLSPAEKVKQWINIAGAAVRVPAGELNRICESTLVRNENIRREKLKLQKQVEENEKKLSMIKIIHKDLQAVLEKSENELRQKEIDAREAHESKISHLKLMLEAADYDLNAAKLRRDAFKQLLHQKESNIMKLKAELAKVDEEVAAAKLEELKWKESTCSTDPNAEQ